MTFIQNESHYNFKGRIMVQHQQPKINAIRQQLIINKPRKPKGAKPFVPLNIEELIEFYENKSKILKVTVKAEIFEGIKSGIVNLIFRRPTKRFMTQITDKKYYYIEVKNAYRDKLIVESDGYFIAHDDHYVRFNDMERELVRQGDYILKLGEVIK